MAGLVLSLAYDWLFDSFFPFFYLLRRCTWADRLLILSHGDDDERILLRRTTAPSGSGGWISLRRLIGNSLAALWGPSSRVRHFYLKPRR